jgi:hypothetical protein
MAAEATEAAMNACNCAHARDATLSADAWLSHDAGAGGVIACGQSLLCWGFQCRFAFALP